MINLLNKLGAVERLELYLHFIKNKSQYTEEEREELEIYFDKDG